MKSRATTYLLLAAVLAVWGVVAWKIFAPTPDAAPAAPVCSVVPNTAQSSPDTLFMDYPDPFLKGGADRTSAVRPVVRALPPPVPKIRREKFSIVHLGTVASKGRTLYILTIGNEQYEVCQGEAAGEFTLSGCDRDSIYLHREGVTYGVARCE